MTSSKQYHVAGVTFENTISAKETRTQLNETFNVILDNLSSYTDSVLNKDDWTVLIGFHVYSTLKLQMLIRYHCRQERNLKTKTNIDQLIH